MFLQKWKAQQVIHGEAQIIMHFKQVESLNMDE